MPKLVPSDHSRDFAGFTYVYPVLSRRAGGISLGINLNINNACNWRCVYCQVPNLIRAKPIAIDLSVLEHEINSMLEQLLNQGLLAKLAPPEFARLNDIAISGNGEPTLSEQFLAVVDLIAKLKSKYAISKTVKTILITNGSNCDKVLVLEALDNLAKQNAQVWFKVDAITKDDIMTINQIDLNISSISMRLKNTAKRCPTYIQTCIFKLNGNEPSTNFILKYIAFILEHKEYIQGVLLYSTARLAQQGFSVTSVSKDSLSYIANELKKHNINVSYYL